MKKEVYFEEVKAIGKRIEALKADGEWARFYEGYYTGMLTGIEYMFIKEHCNDDEAWEEFKAIRKEVEGKIYESKSV